MKMLRNLIFLGVFALMLSHTPTTFAAHVDYGHTDCSQPYQTGSKYDNSTPGWSPSTFTYQKAKSKWIPNIVVVDPKTGATEDHGEWYDYHELTTVTCEIKVTEDKSGKYTNGIVKYTAYGHHPNAAGSSPTTKGEVYWVKEVDISLTDENGRNYDVGTTNGTSNTSSPKDGNPSNTNNSGLVSYSDESVPTVSCYKTYGDPPSSRRTCGPNAEVDKSNGDSKQRLTCYRWIDPYTKDSDKVCTVRMYVNSVKITEGEDTTYTGKRYNYECQATYPDGTTRVISQLDKKKQKYVWLSYPQEKNMSFLDGRYIGSHWEKGYKDPRGTYHPPSNLHEFYPVDSEDRTYILNCTYYPGIKWVQQYYGSSWNTQWDRVRQENNIISDYDNGPSGPWHQEIHDKKTVKHIGIKEMNMKVTGEFPKHDEAGLTWETTDPETLEPGTNQEPFKGGWNLTDKVNSKSYAPGYWDEQHFLTGHWYDFEVEIEYTDGETRDVTSAEEIYWDSTPWFTDQEKFKTEFFYDSGMSKTGLDHRIPQHGWNTIDVEYLHQNVPFGKTEYNRTKETNRLKAKQVNRLQITGEESKDSEPIKEIIVDETRQDEKEVQYHAWVTWTFGREANEEDIPENWTNFVRWDGDYLKAANNEFGDEKNISITDKWETNTGGFYDFEEVKGKEQKTTVYADYLDVDNLILESITRVIDDKGTLETKPYDTGQNNWEAIHDKVEVVITDCEDVPHLAWECDLPEDYWRIDFNNRFDIFHYSKIPEKISNFYPDPSYYNQDAWGNGENEGEDDNDLYMYQRKFPVSGTGSGLGNQ